MVVPIFKDVQAIIFLSQYWRVIALVRGGGSLNSNVAAAALDYLWADIMVNSMDLAEKRRKFYRCLMPPLVSLMLSGQDSGVLFNYVRRYSVVLR